MDYFIIHFGIILFHLKQNEYGTVFEFDN